MKYKNRLLCLLAAITLPALAQARPHENGGERGKGFDKLDTNGDQVITLEEAESAGAKRLVEHFAEIDADGSGEVTKEELRAHHEQRREEHRAKLEAMDTDGNGAISLEEATAAGAEKLVEHFDRIDRNGDGELDRHEMRPPRKCKEQDDREER